MRSAARIGGLEWALLGALFLLSFLAIVVTANDYGPTYDEPHYASAGVEYAEWWARAFRLDTGAFRGEEIERAWRLNHEHPPLQKCSSGFAQRWFGGARPGLTAMRLPSALWFALAICALYLFTRRVWGRRGALFSALALATLPRVFAHAHLVALDIPIVAWFFITVALTAEAMRRDSWWWAVLAGIAFGLALLSKMNAFFLPVLLLPWGLIWHRRQWAKLVVAVFVVGPAVFWLGWPWLWIAPIAHLREYLAFHLGHAAYNVWYLRTLYQSAPWPWHYPFVLTAVTTPALVLLLGIGGAARSWPRRGVDPDRALLLLGLAIALLPSALPTSPKYNGVRLFLPAFPFLAALAGGGFAWLQAKVVARLPAGGADTQRLSALVCAALGAALLWPSAGAVSRTHPYELAYYNAFASGAQRATRPPFETIYWGQVFGAAPDFLNGVEKPDARVLLIPGGVIYLLEMQQRAGALRTDVQFTGDEAEAGSVDYVMFQAMQSDYTDLCWSLVENEEPAWALRPGETPLLLAYDRDAVAAALARLGK